MFSSPISSAIVRSSRWPISQRNPSAISARTDPSASARADSRSSLAAPGSVAEPGWPAAFAEARYDPVTSPTRAALAAYVPALTKNGTHAASTNRNPPSGPATMFCISVVPPISQPLARSSRSLDTTAGITAWLADRKMTSPVLMRNSAASSRTMLDRPARIAVASTAITTTRDQSIATISRRRSTRSTSTPPGIANSSQGSQEAPEVSATTSGLLVCAATYSGAAIVARPLPRADSVLAVQSFANRWSDAVATTGEVSRRKG